MKSATREQLRSLARQLLPPAMKRRVKRMVRAWHERFFPFTPADLTRAIHALGVGSGDVVMVHSSFDEFHGFRGGPVDAVRALQDAVGSGGTLLMPTVPFRTDAVEYALGNPVFDAKRTPSRMGLITEVFRRTPGVVRSIHPTHSVAAWGHQAREIIAGHERSLTPCGRATPYGRLLQHSGKILFLGVSAGTMTFSYFVAEELEPRLSRPVLTPSTYPMQWKDRNGILRLSHFRLFCVDLDHDPRLLIAELKRRKQWREGRAGSLSLILLEAVDVYRAAAALAERGLFLSGQPAPAAAERMAYA